MSEIPTVNQSGEEAKKADHWLAFLAATVVIHLMADSMLYQIILCHH
jgi:hypothetical protein